MLSFAKFAGLANIFDLLNCDKRRDRIAARKLWLRKGGGVATMFAVAIVPILMSAGVAVDYGFLYREKVFLRSRVDAAAIAGAREMSLANASESQIIAAAKASAYQSGEDHNGTPFTIDVSVDVASNQVKITLTEYWKPFLAQFFDSAITPIVVTAATRSTGQKICVLGLDSKSNATIHMRANSKLVGPGCGVVSNSASSASIRMDDGATMQASFICAAGGTFGKSSAYMPDALMDCPAYPDPFATRPAPSFGACNYTGTHIKTGNKTLYPGVYCKGITIAGEAEVVFKPGIYIIKDGRFKVTDTAKISGENVGFYMTGRNSFIKFAKHATISLIAPESGSMAGLLFFEDKNVVGGVHEISSDNARLLLGTFYLPKSELLINADRPVADQSAYTAIIVNNLRLEAGPVLTLNSDYGATNVPVPEALKNVRGYGSKLVFIK